MASTSSVQATISTLRQPQPHRGCGDSTQNKRLLTPGHGITSLRLVLTLGGVTPELRQLRDVLDAQRAGVLKKLAGLNDVEARRSTVDSGTNLAGLVQHLTFVESKWFEQIVDGRHAARGSRSMHVDPTVSLGTLPRRLPRGV